ncbi:MAG: carboxypeptidase-like regulatory domain-containing protein [Flavobacterium sp.]
MKFKFLTLTLFFTISLLAQKGTISGTLTDKDMNNEPLPFANAIIKGTTIGTTTDENGKFTLSVDPGNYTLQFSFLGYETVEIPVSVKANQTVTVNSPMSAGGGVQLADVVIVTTRRKNTDAAIMAEMKEAKQVVSAISAEQMSKGTDSNAAQAIQRVPGVTIVDGRFVMIRGLNERYNNVLINNALAPSTEVDKRTFSFDLIPTGAIDKMVIYKTGSPDLPGDFSGGIIKITTSENVSDYNMAGIGIGYRAGTTFGDYLQSEGSKTDFLGFDNNFRPLPGNFPSIGAINSNNALSIEAANSLQNNFNPTSRSAFLDNSVGVGIGRNIELKNGKRLMTTNTLSYSNSFQSYNREFKRYTSLNPGETRPPIWFDYLDQTYQNDVRITLMSNWIYRLNANNVLKFKNLFNQIGENETVLRDGFNFLQRGNDEFNNYSLGYRSRSIYMGQLEGEHKVKDNNSIDWVLGFNYLTESEPDLRRFRTLRLADDPNGEFFMIDPASSNLFDTGRYFGNLKEFSVANGGSYTHYIERVRGDEELESIKLKGGYYFDYKDRQFDARYVSYFLASTISSERRDFLTKLPLNEIFSSAYMNATEGWVLREGTRPIDTYTATNMLTAGYAMAELPLGKFNITTGVRIEHNIQELNSQDDFEKIIVNNPITSVLPSLNVGYNLTERALLRLAYSKTVNRPEFREIAPFLFYDFENEAARVGNKDLEIAVIDNLDFRYEFYPNKGETISIGGFYKFFSKPIENVTQITTEQPQFLYQNADSAYNFGVEIEMRKSFKDVFNNWFLKRLSANLNASYIESRVDLGDDVTSQDQKRALQGQSPYIVNVALGYDDDKGVSANLIYNRFGDRIFSVGDVIFPTIYELSRDQLDFTISKTFEKYKVKLGIQDLLNAKFKFFEDSNRDEKIKKQDDNPISVFRRGTLFNLNVTYNF